MAIHRWILYCISFSLVLMMLSSCLPATPVPTDPTLPVLTATTINTTTIPTPTKIVEPTPVAVETSLRESDGMIMAHVPSGEFSMGSNDGEADEAPVHEVYLDSFWMDTTEITNRMYSLCVEAGGCKPPLQTSSYTRPSYYGDLNYAEYPVIYVDWSMANAYCQWVGAHLPTEAQWEKAASGGDDRIFPWGDDWDVDKRKRLNFADGNNPETTSDITLNDGFRDSAPVGSFPAGASPYGIYDMAGNVWEWVADWYDPTYYVNSPASNPEGPSVETSLRALRGASWVAANEDVFRTSNRNGLDPSKSSESLGFRCAQ
jgi:formylglycine-generating enzyme required for sulfatase activity